MADEGQLVKLGNGRWARFRQLPVYAGDVRGALTLLTAVELDQHTQELLEAAEVSLDAYRQRGFSGLVEVPVATRTTVGFSALVTRAELSQVPPPVGTQPGLPGLRQVYGLFGRWAPIEQIGFVLEGDIFLNNNLGSGIGSYKIFKTDVSKKCE